MSQEKTEQPTQKKLKDARDKGDVPRSKELPAVSTLVFAFIYLLAFGGGLADTIKEAFSHGFVFTLQDLDNSQFLRAKIESSFYPIAGELVYLFIAVVMIAVASNGALGGFVISGKKLIPDYKKLSLISGIKKMFSMNQAVELVKSILKAMLVLIPLSLIMPDKFLSYMSSKLLYDPKFLVGVVAHDVISWGLIFSCIFIFVVAIDVPYQIYSFTKKNKMTKQEIKDEYKNSEGDPIIKQMRKQKQYEISRKAAQSNIQSADMIIVNPTHYAVGLKYDMDSMNAPKVVALGADNIALAMRSKAAEMMIPVLEIPPLARVLYNTTEVGDEIPAELFAPVATVVSYIYGLEDRLAFNINDKFVKSLEIDEGKFIK